MLLGIGHIDSAGESASEIALGLISSWQKAYQSYISVLRRDRQQRKAVTAK